MVKEKDSQFFIITDIYNNKKLEKPVLYYYCLNNFIKLEIVGAYNSVVECSPDKRVVTSSILVMLINKSKELSKY